MIFFVTIILIKVLQHGKSHRNIFLKEKSRNSKIPGVPPEFQGFTGERNIDESEEEQNDTSGHEPGSERRR